MMEHQQILRIQWDWALGIQINPDFFASTLGLGQQNRMRETPAFEQLFIFPKSPRNYREVNELPELRENLIYEITKKSHFKKNLFLLTVQNESNKKVLKAICSRCKKKKARLIYEKTYLEIEYKLVEFHNRHDHRVFKMARPARKASSVLAEKLEKGVEFKFPKDAGKFRKIKNALDFKVLLYEERIKLNIGRQFFSVLQYTNIKDKKRNRFTTSEVIKIHAKCLGCDARIIYRKTFPKNEYFELEEFQNVHCHSNQPKELDAEEGHPVSKDCPEHLSCSNLQNYEGPEFGNWPLQEAPFSGEGQEGLEGAERGNPRAQQWKDRQVEDPAELLAVRNFVLGQGTMRRRNKVGHLVRFLEENEYTCRFDGQAGEGGKRVVSLKQIEGCPYLLICSPSMRRNYSKYGQLVYVKVVPITADMGECQADRSVMVFLGKNNVEGFIPFAFCYSREATEDREHNYRFVAEVLVQFVAMHGGKPPQSIVTDISHFYIQVLQRFRKASSWAGAHLYDSAELELLLLSQAKSEEIKDRLTQCLSEKNPHTYAAWKQEITSMVGCREDSELVRTFLLWESMYCPSQTPRSFHGLEGSCYFYFDNALSFEALKQRLAPLDIVTTLLYDSVRELLHSSLRIEESEQEVGVSRVTGSEAQEGGDEKEESPTDELLKRLRVKYPSAVLQRILANFKMSPIYTLRKDSEHEKIYVRREESNETFEIKVSKEAIKCDCGEFEKTGIPCPHVFCVLRDIREYRNWNIHPRWLKEKSPCDSKV